MSKGISYICSRVVGFISSKYWTFEQQRYSHAEVIRFVAMNVLTLGINVLTNQAMLTLWAGRILLAWVIATMITNLFTFVLLKWWVFNTGKKESG